MGKPSMKVPCKSINTPCIYKHQHKYIVSLFLRRVFASESPDNYKVYAALITMKYSILLCQVPLDSLFLSLKLYSMFNDMICRDPGYTFWRPMLRHFASSALEARLSPAGGGLYLLQPEGPVLPLC